MTAEQQIIVRLTAKCAEVVEGADYDWTSKEAQEKPSDYINDCLHFLETTFLALYILPVSPPSPPSPPYVSAQSLVVGRRGFKSCSASSQEPGLAAGENSALGYQPSSLHGSNSQLQC